jgi:hypothetical protein
MEELKLDRSDAYNRWVRYVAVPALTAYGAMTVLSSHTVEEKDGMFRYAARDTGLVMTTTSVFPKSLLATHMWSGIALFTLTVIQKAVVYGMSTSYKYYRDIHGALGFFILLLSLSMAAAGFGLGLHSALPSFVAFSVLFSAPWVFWSVSVWWSASMKRIQLHRLLGNMMLKGCLAVPLSRVVGSVLQQQGWGEAEGYYQGIGFASVVVGVWQIMDLIEFWGRKVKRT